MVEEFIFVNFITGPEVGIRMPSNSYMHESANGQTEGQEYIKQFNDMKLRMNWGRHLTPWPEHLQPWLNTPKEQKRIATGYNLYTQCHPGYLAPKEDMVEDNIETIIKSPDPDTTRNDGYLIQVLHHISQRTIGTCTTSLQSKLLL
jgi:hypothetical protein